MKNAKIILILGLIVAILPYVGMPSSWYRPFVFFGGIAITLFALRSVAITFPEIRQPQLFDAPTKTTTSDEHE